ncbi:hypothetical protein ACFOWA_14330 [Pedobacter lithocola]|uniref:Uncharacterized protein n=1 Tax=Pedobacter lithocola TaxID=1908239 RepID=A0ABV8PED3_9SPHI
MKQYFRLSDKAQTYYILFQEIAGLNKTIEGCRHLSFKNGKIYGHKFISFLADVKKKQVDELYLQLLSELAVVSQWKLENVKVLDYLLTNVQLTED